MNHNQLLVVVTNHACSLKCVDCGNLNPFLPRFAKQALADPAVVRHDLARLAPVLQTEVIQIQGGEPLLHPRLAELIHGVAEAGIGKQIVLATNATHRLSPAAADACQQHRVSVRISDYGLRQQHVAAVVAQCVAHRIDHSVYSFAAGDSTWYYLGRLGQPRNDDDRIVGRIYRACPFNVCWTLVDGALARCARSANGHLAGLHPHFPCDFIDVRRSVNLDGDLAAWVSGTGFLEACRYCYGAEGVKIPAGRQAGATRRLYV